MTKQQQFEERLVRGIFEALEDAARERKERRDQNLKEMLDAQGK